MNELKTKISGLLKLLSSKWLVILGVAGIVLIYLSSLIPDSSASETKKSETESSVTADEYCSSLQQKTTDIVISITGDTSPTVVITLDSSAQYVYAGDEKQKNASENTETEKEYITVKDSAGDEKAVVITEYMPEVRGVAVVCVHGSNEIIRKEITNAVSAVLGISSSKIYVTGTD